MMKLRAYRPVPEPQEDVLFHSMHDRRAQLDKSARMGNNDEDLTGQLRDFAGKWKIPLLIFAHPGIGLSGGRGFRRISSSLGRGFTPYHAERSMVNFCSAVRLCFRVPLLWERRVLRMLVVTISTVHGRENRM
jgi:hypothetical protein